jgi:DNA-binding CsgD family transcriptional regulator
MPSNSPPSPPRSRPTAGAANALVLDATLATTLGAVIRTVGLPGFLDALLDLLDSVCAMHSGGVMVFSRHQAPRLLLYRRRRSARTVQAVDYFSGPYILDPNYNRFLAGCGSGVYWLRDVAPDEFQGSEFYRLFYSQVGLSDYVDMLWRIDADTAVSIFLERDTSCTGFLPQDIAALNAVLPLLVSAVERHHEHVALVPAPGDGGQDGLTHRKVQSSIENFGRSLLTRREREVLFYMLSGYSAALTAARMTSTEGTIKIQRKSIHRKLDIGSQAELFALFIRCIPYAIPGTQTDPLQAYQSVDPARSGQVPDEVASGTTRGAPYGAPRRAASLVPDA